MNIEETKEAIKVMQAFVDGKEIECSCPLDGRGWETEDDPVWDFGDCYYRIKREPHYRPYANAEECFVDVKKHGGWIKGIDETTEGYHYVTAVLNNGVDSNQYCPSYEFMMKMFVWADDGSVCGVKEE